MRNGEYGRTGTDGQDGLETVFAGQGEPPKSVVIRAGVTPARALANDVPHGAHQGVSGCLGCWRWPSRTDRVNGIGAFGIGAFGFGRLTSSQFPPNRLTALAR